jgi:putative transposase
MTRLAGPEEPGVPLHVVQRGAHGAPCFHRERDGCEYLYWLRALAERFGCAVHAYVLMRNHVHLLVTPAGRRGGSRLARALGERYARYLAETRGRAGPVWGEPFDLSPVYAPRYLLSCMRYIEENPVRAGLAAEPGNWRWSSHGANALGREDPIVTPHAVYCALGRTPEFRRARYRALFWPNKVPSPRASGGDPCVRIEAAPRLKSP